jgi:hypothetical protein
MLDSGTHIQKEVSHIFPHHTRRQMDIVITRDDFWTWSDFVIANPTRTNLVQGVSTTTTHVTTIVVQDKTQSYIERMVGDDFIPLAIDLWLFPCSF